MLADVVSAGGELSRSCGDALAAVVRVARSCAEGLRGIVGVSSRTGASFIHSLGLSCSHKELLAVGN